MAHAADLLDTPAVAEHVRLLLEHAQLAERLAAQRAAGGRGDDLRQVTNEQARHGRPGVARPCSAAAAAASG